MKKELKELFKKLYPKKRLLAIQLNGFTHKVFYDNGRGTVGIQIEEYSQYVTCERETSQTKELLGNISHLAYKGDPLEIIYLAPDQR